MNAKNEFSSSISLACGENWHCWSLLLQKNLGMILKDEITVNFASAGWQCICLMSKDCLSVQNPERGRGNEKAREVKGKTDQFSSQPPKGQGFLCCHCAQCQWHLLPTEIPSQKVLVSFVFLCGGQVYREQGMSIYWNVRKQINIY